MVQSDKNTADEGGEIDRIMKEIEDLEKKMDSPEETTPNDSADDSGKVVAIRPEAVDEAAPADSVFDNALAETTSTEYGTSEGGLAMKIGGCADVSLEFTRAGVTVTLSCNDDGLSISTDQGAEFRIPFKRAA